jgi:hypothetical protein
VPVLAKDDKGVPTGVCQNGIDLRDSVDDENTNRAEDWRQLALSTKTLAMLSQVGNRDSVDPGALAASIEPASWHPSYRGPSGLLTGAASKQSHKIGGEEYC